MRCEGDKGKFSRAVSHWLSEISMAPDNFHESFNMREQTGAYLFWKRDRLTYNVVNFITGTKTKLCFLRSKTGCIVSNRFEFHRRFARVCLLSQSEACMGLKWPIRGQYYWHLSTMAGLRSKAWWDILRWPILCISISHWMKLKSCKNPCKKKGGVSLWPGLQDPPPWSREGSRATESDI